MEETAARNYELLQKFLNYFTFKKIFDIINT